MSQGFTPPQPYAVEPRRRGCFFYGCITAIVLFVLGVAGISALSYILYGRFATLLKENADDAPTPLPKVMLPPEAREALDNRVKTFLDGVNVAESAADTPTPEPLVLDTDELNTLIAEHGENLADHFRVQLVDDHIDGQISMPLDGLNLFGLFGLKGKFINAEGRFQVSLSLGLLMVVLDEAKVKGKPVPDSMLEAFRKDNLAKSFNQDPAHTATLRKLQSIEVKGSKLIIKAKPNKPEADLDKAKDDAKDKVKEKGKEASKDIEKSKDEAKPKSKDEPKVKDEDDAKPKDEAKPKT